MQATQSLSTNTIQPIYWLRNVIISLPNPTKQSIPQREPEQRIKGYIDTADAYDARAALADFHAARAGVRGLIESSADVVSVPPLFLAPNGRHPSSPPLETTTPFAVPIIDLSSPRPSVVALLRAAVRTCGFFHVTNHGVCPGAALAAAWAFHGLPLATRSPFYSSAGPVKGVLYSTMPNDPPRHAADPAAIPVLPWRDTLHVNIGQKHLTAPGGGSLGRLPVECRDALVEYQRAVSDLGKTVAGLLSEALGVGAGRLAAATQVEASNMACHYYLPCPEPTRVMGSLEHTDPSLFAVLAQDAMGGLVARLGSGGGWIDVPPVPDTLLVNIGDLLKVVSNDEFMSVEHKVRIKSTRDARVSVAVFFNPVDDSQLIGPLPELVAAAGKPERYRSFTMAEFMDSRRELGHGTSWITRFAPIL